MPELINAQEASQALDQILDQVAGQGREILLERGGKPVAALIPMPTFELLELGRQEAAERFFCLVDRLRRQVREQDPQELQQAIFEADATAKQAGYVRSGR